MAISALPDLSGAIRAYLRSIPAIAAVVGDRVWLGWPKGPDGTLRLKVPPYVHAILVESGRGGLGADPEAPYQSERVDISCLGPSEAEAHALWRLVGAYLVDPQRVRPAGFRAANTLVSGVAQEGGPLRLIDPTGWPRTACGYQFRYCAIPLSEVLG